MSNVEKCTNQSAVSQTTQAKQYKCVILAVTRDYSNRGKLDDSHNGVNDDDIMADISITVIPDPKSEPSSPKGQTDKNFASLSNILPFVDPKLPIGKNRLIGKKGQYAKIG